MICPLIALIKLCFD